MKYSLTLNVKCYVTNGIYILKERKSISCIKYFTSVAIFETLKVLTYLQRSISKSDRVKLWVYLLSARSGVAGIVGIIRQKSSDQNQYIVTEKNGND